MRAQALLEDPEINIWTKLPLILQNTVTTCAPTGHAFQPADVPSWKSSSELARLLELMTLEI